MPKVRKRRPDRLIGFKAFEDADQDIIDWWDNLAPGHRSEVLRGLIRQHALSDTDDSSTLILREIGLLRQNMSAQFRSLTQRIGEGGAPAPKMPMSDGGLSDEEAKRREESILQRKW